MTIRSVLRGALLGLAVLPLALQSAEAAKKKSTPKEKEKPAAPAPARKKSLALGSFTGTKSGEVRGWVQEALQEEFTLTDAEDFKTKNTKDGYAKMASALGVDAVVVGKVERQRTVITVRSADGEVVKEIVIKGQRGPRLQKAVQAGVPKAIATAIGADEPAEAPPEPAPEEKEKPAAEEKPDEPAAEDPSSEETSSEEEEAPADEAPAEEAAGDGEVVGPPLVLTAGVRFINRSLKFKDALARVSNPAYGVRDYPLALGPAVFARAQFYPGALLGGGFISNVGLIGGFEYGIPVKTKYAGSVPGVPPELDNKMQEFYVGSRLRFPGESNEFGAQLAYGRHKFTLGGDEMVALIPDVEYSYLRIGGDAEFDFGNLFVGAELGVRLVLDTGDLQKEVNLPGGGIDWEKTWFPNTGGNGVDFGLRLGYQLADAIAIVVGGDFVRYGFDFNPVDRQATRVAGGATDTYLSGFVGARFSLGGSAGASAGAASVSAEAEASTSEDASTDEGGSDGGASDDGAADESDAASEE